MRECCSCQKMEDFKKTSGKFLQEANRGCSTQNSSWRLRRSLNHINRGWTPSTHSIAARLAAITFFPNSCDYELTALLLHKCIRISIAVVRGCRMVQPLPSYAFLSHLLVPCHSVSLCHAHQCPCAVPVGVSVPFQSVSLSLLLDVLVLYHLYHAHWHPSAMPAGRCAVSGM